MVHQINELAIKFEDLNIIPRSDVLEGHLAPEKCPLLSSCAPFWMHLKMAGGRQVGKKGGKEGREERGKERIRDRGKEGGRKLLKELI